MSNELSKGAYKAKIEQQAFESNNDKIRFVLDFTVLRQVGVDGRESPLPVPVRRNTALFLTPPKPGKDRGGIHMAVDCLKAVAPEWDGDLGKLEPGMPGHFSLVGREVTIINEGKRDAQSKYDTWSLPLPGGVKERKSDPVAAARAAALLRSLGGTPTPTAPKPNPAAQVLEDVPF